MWASAAGCMRNYLILKERAAAFRADPEVQEALRASRLDELAQPTLADGRPRRRCSPTARPSRTSTSTPPPRAAWPSSASTSSPWTTCWARAADRDSDRDRPPVPPPDGTGGDRAVGPAGPEFTGPAGPAGSGGLPAGEPVRDLVVGGLCVGQLRPVAARRTGTGARVLYSAKRSSFQEKPLMSVHGVVLTAADRFGDCGRPSRVEAASPPAARGGRGRTTGW